MNNKLKFVEEEEEDENLLSYILQLDKINDSKSMPKIMGVSSNKNDPQTKHLKRKGAYQNMRV